jgi:hypothetical protein
VLPSGSTSRGATTPARGSAAPAVTSRSSAPGRSATSALDAASHGDAVRDATRLTARP